MESTDCIVVGAGVVGLAVARTLAAAGREVLVLEAEPRIGEHTSSRNSEVIHAGLYYKKGSLRQRLFPRAAQLMYAYCAEHGVPHKRLGKLVIARTADEADHLRQHMTHATEAGLDDLQWLDPDQTRELEPNLACHAAYLSPSSGIVDSHALMLAYQAEVESHGGTVVLRAPVTAGAVTPQGIRVEVGGAEPMTLVCKTLINCAGHGAPGLGRAIAGLSANSVPRGYFKRGIYFSVTGRPFKRLIYPIHGPGGMDIHAVIDLAGNVKFEPDSNGSTGSTIRSMLPGASRSIARSVGSGRACPMARFPPPMQVSGPRSRARMNRRPISSSKVRAITEFPIWSICSASKFPGLTSSLAIGEYVAGLLGLAAPMPLPALRAAG